MAWQDRSYYRDGSASGTNPLMWLLTGSIPLFTLAGVRVRMHVSMLIYIGCTLAFAQSDGFGVGNAMTSMTILFISVLLHEYGHCFGARYVGGTADEILMWPLGGLAMVDPPHRPWASFFTTAAGPMVNVILCLLTGTTIAILNHSVGAVPFFPFRGGFLHYIPRDLTTYYLWWVFVVNYGLLMFNLLLVFYPFDGGRMIQALLWVKIGYYRSMLIATVIGMIGAVFIAGLGVATLPTGLTLIIIAVFGFYASYRQRYATLEMGPDEWNDSTDYSAAYEVLERPKKKKKVSQRSIQKLRKRVKEAALERERIDRILAKVSAHGLTSLTWSERRALRKATEKQRKRDLELSQL